MTTFQKVLLRGVIFALIITLLTPNTWIDRVPVWLLIIAFVITRILDVHSTMMGVRHYGLAGEQNPGARWIIQRFGFKGIIVVQIIGATALIPLLYVMHAISGRVAFFIVVFFAHPPIFNYLALTLSTKIDESDSFTIHPRSRDKNYWQW